MTDLVPIRRALISVSDKTGVIPFARSLVSYGVEIVSTGGTARLLADAGVEVIEIEEVTGFPEMMDGRIKTLHPAVHGAILARRDDESHESVLRKHGMTPIDLVCVNLYPFERTRRENLPRDEAIELIDIGGPAMIRSAAKNHAFVTVVTDPAQYDRVVEEMMAHDGATTLELRCELAAEAFSRTTEYDAMISAWMRGPDAAEFPSIMHIVEQRQTTLRYGENPHQEAAVYIDPAARGAGVIAARVLHGKPLSYNNLNDASAGFELACDFARQFSGDAGAVIAKHTNPCGAAVADSLADAFDRAYRGDPLAAYGGILVVNQPIDPATAALICEGQKFFEVIVAPSFDTDACAMLGERWKNVRLLATGEIASAEADDSIEFRSIPGGMLVQERDRALADPVSWRHVAGPPPDEQSLNCAAFVWLVAKHLKSNAIAIGDESHLIGAGAGQMDRITAARLAVEKAGDRLAATTYPIAASDGFFPFPDGPELLIDAGVLMIVQPGGSKRDQDTIDLCAERGVTLLLAGVRHFRH